MLHTLDTACAVRCCSRFRNAQAKVEARADSADLLLVASTVNSRFKVCCESGAASACHCNQEGHAVLSALCVRKTGAALQFYIDCPD